MASKRSPSALSLDLLRQLGYHGDTVERTLPDRRRTKKDWCGFADFIVVHHAHGFLILQVTSDNGGNVSARVKRGLACDAAPSCLLAGAKVEVWGWSVRRGTWHVRRVAIKLKDGELYSEQIGQAAGVDEITEEYSLEAVREGKL